MKGSFTCVTILLSSQSCHNFHHSAPVCGDHVHVCLCCETPACRMVQAITKTTSNVFYSHGKRVRSM